MLRSWSTLPHKVVILVKPRARARGKGSQNGAIQGRECQMHRL